MGGRGDDMECSIVFVGVEGMRKEYTSVRRVPLNVLACCSVNQHSTLVSRSLMRQGILFVSLRLVELFC